jgi:hypothetical protein
MTGNSLLPKGSDRERGRCEAAIGNQPTDILKGDKRSDLRLSEVAKLT